MSTNGAKETTSIVILGATGDLAQRKLLPALFHLWCKDRIAPSTNIVGFSRSNFSDEEFREFMWDRIHDIGTAAPRSPHPSAHRGPRARAARAPQRSETARLLDGGIFPRARPVSRRALLLRPLARARPCVMRRLRRRAPHARPLEPLAAPNR